MVTHEFPGAFFFVGQASSLSILVRRIATTITSLALASPVNPNTAMSFGIGRDRKDRLDRLEARPTDIVFRVFGGSDTLLRHGPKSSTQVERPG